MHTEEESFRDISFMECTSDGEHIYERLDPVCYWMYFLKYIIFKVYHIDEVKLTGVNICQLNG